MTVSRHRESLQHNQNFEENRNQERLRIEEEDRRLRENAEREMRGLPSREIEEYNAQVRERQRAYFESQQQPQEQQQQPAAQQPQVDDAALQALCKQAAMTWQSTFETGRRYFPSKRNFELFVSVIERRGYDPTKPETYDQVYREIESQLERPTAPAAPTSTAQPEEPLPPGAERAPDGTVYTAEQIERMSAEEYKRVFRLSWGSQVTLRDGRFHDFSGIKTFADLGR